MDDSLGLNESSGSAAVAVVMSDKSEKQSLSTAPSFIGNSWNIESTLSLSDENISKTTTMARTDENEEDQQRPTVDQSEQMEIIFATETEMNKINAKQESTQETGVVTEVNPMGDVEMKSVQSNQSFDFCSDSDTEDEEGNVLVDSESTISRNLDMRLLCSIIDQGRPTLERTRGQKVVLILGKTGTGKSTLVQALAGKKFISFEHETQLRGQIARQIVFDVAPDDSDEEMQGSQPLPGFEIGYVQESRTKHVNCYAINNSVGEPLYLVDSPGWEDTNGAEIDIATACMHDFAYRSTSQKCRFRHPYQLYFIVGRSWRCYTIRVETCLQPGAQL
mmetsp:Transcript_27713/g.39148  ORF Transcript_27713/g.39148 Transcript_27713/m.39148 type:complete len:334 (+) Transcript_27713:846-1847(+)